MGNENMEEFSAKEMISKIKENKVDPSVLSKPARVACVEFLLLGGFLHAEIAHFLKKSDRTIRRDMEDVRKSYGVGKNAALTQDFLGEFLLNARMHHAQLVKIARSSTTPSAEKARAEFMAWKVNKDVLAELFLWVVLFGRPFVLSIKK